MKFCYKCKQKKPLESFFKNRTTASGRQSLCKVCKSQVQREYKWKVANDPDSIKRIKDPENRIHNGYNSKLEKSDIILIRGLFGFLSVNQIAEKFEVHPSTISQIKTGKTWAWVK